MYDNAFEIDKNQKLYNFKISQLKGKKLKYPVKRGKR